MRLCSRPRGGLVLTLGDPHLAVVVDPKRPFAHGLNVGNPGRRSEADQRKDPNFLCCLLPSELERPQPWDAAWSRQAPARSRSRTHNGIAAGRDE